MKPAYIKIAEAMENDLISRKYACGVQLPDEKELMAAFQANRKDVRKALAVLVNKGLIYPMQPNGYFPRPSAYDNCISLESYRGFSREFPNQKVEGIPLKLEVVKADEQLAEKFRIEPGEALYYLERLRKVDDEPYSLEYIWYSKELMGDLTEEIAKGSIYRYITRDLQLSIGFADRVLSADRLSSQEAEILNLKENDPAFCMQNTVFLSDGNVLEVSNVVHNYKKCKMTKLAGWN